MKTLSKMLLLGAVLIFVASCEQNLNDVALPENNAVLKNVEVSTDKLKSVDGVLKFRDMVAFKETVEELKKLNHVDRWEQNFDGFVSMRAAAKKIDDKSFSEMGITNSVGTYKNILHFEGSGQNRVLRLNIADPILSVLVNSEGLLMIGDSAVKITPQLVYFAKASAISQLRNDEKMYSNKVISSFKIKSGNPSARTAAGCSEGVDYDTPSNPSWGQFRFFYEIWSSNYGFFSSAGARILHEAWRSLLGLFLEI